MRKRTVFISFFTSTQPCPSDLSVRTHPAEMLAFAFERARDFRRFPTLAQTKPERAHTHTHVTHRMRVRTQITWTWLCTRGKKRYKYRSFSHTNRSFRVLGHQCVVTMGNCLIWISLCMFFFPLIETVTYTCHYMTDRLERFDLKTSKLDLLKKKRHLHLGCPWGKLIYQILISKWTISLTLLICEIPLGIG